MNPTNQLLAVLKENNQDFEWYPTTDEMIAAVSRWLPADAGSILDIGAGDGRVLVSFAEKCKRASLYSIEIAPILHQRQPKEIIPAGTDLFEQNLSAISVDYIYSNPRYSQYEEWVVKIISEGFAKKAFLTIPQRWKDSKPIENALKQRGATARVIYSGDFLDAPRQARAVIDIIEVTFPRDSKRYDETVKDPFDIWFDQNINIFEHAEEFKESETSKDLARQFAHASIDEMVEAYTAEYTLLESNYRAIFKLDQEILRELGIDKTKIREGLKKKMKDLKIKYWQILFERLDAITSRLTTESRKRLLEKLTNNTSVEFTVSNAYSVVLWAIKNANQYFDEQLIKLFRELSTFEGAQNYKSNTKTWEKDGWRWNAEKFSHYALDYRIVVERWGAMKDEKKYPWGSTWEYPGDLKRECHELIADVIAVMSNLGFTTHSNHSMNRQWVGGQWENWYKEGEILFQTKAYKNGNMHFRFMPSAIKALSVEAGRLLGWIRTKEDVVTEMGMTPQEANRYFKSNTQLLPSNVGLLGAPAPAPEPEPKKVFTDLNEVKDKYFAKDPEQVSLF